MILNENDFLTHQLYTASKSATVKKTRIRSWILTTMAFIALAYLFFQSDNDSLGYYFSILSALSLILYPIYSRWRYKRHYRKYIRDTYQNRFGEECTIDINEDAILTKDKTGEAKINITEIEAVNEIRDYYFIKLRIGTSIIISKSKANDLDRIQKLLSLITKKGIKHNIELDWMWR